MRHGYAGIRAESYAPLVRLRVTGRTHRGWILDEAASPAPAPPPGLTARTRRLLSRRAV